MRFDACDNCGHAISWKMKNSLDNCICPIFSVIYLNSIYE